MAEFQTFTSTKNPQTEDHINGKLFYLRNEEKNDLSKHYQAKYPNITDEELIQIFNYIESGSIINPLLNSQNSLPVVHNPKTQ